MPMMNSAQLAALVERARQKALPVVVSPPQPARTARRPVQPQKAVPAPPVPAPQSDHGVEAAPDDFPVGWELRKESWHFHRRFYRVFRRPMAHGEYSHLLWQIRRRKAEHLGEDCWRVTLPDGRRTLAVRATRWRLLTILPKDWQPPVPVEPAASAQ